jgi:hypothetical protein
VTIETTFFDVDQFARELVDALNKHKDKYRFYIVEPSTQPLFTTQPDGSVTDRRGLLVRAAPKKE